MKFDDRGAQEPFARNPGPPVTIMERSIARRRGGQFTIGYLMVAVVAIAYLLAIPGLFYVIAITLSAPFLPLFAARWLLGRQHISIAAWIFWLAASTINLYIALFCVVPDASTCAFTFIYPGLLVAIPTIASFGTTWALLLSRDDAIAPIKQRLAGLSVVLMTVLPLVTLTTFWPLRLAFLVAEPKLERLAEQIATGGPVGFPQQAGLFRVFRPSVEPVTHYVGLRIDKTWYRPTGFVRLRSGPTPKCYGPFLGQNFDIYLGGGWWYRG